MRVIAGTARGKNLQALPGEDITRPTINRVKEAMFSSVQFLVPGARVLDLFAGSGQLGIEALSRGAKSCLFVDRSAEALAVVKANCKTAGVDRQSDIRQGEAESFLANIRGPFDLALLDPPFHHDTVAAVLPLLAAKMAPGGVVLCETEREADLPEQAGRLVVDALQNFAAVDAVVRAALCLQAAGQRDVFTHGVLREKVEGLKHQPERQSAAAFCRADAAVKQRFARHADAPGIRLLQRVQAAQQRRLAAAGRAEDGQRLALLQRERDVLQDGRPAEALFQMLDFQNGHVRPSSQEKYCSRFSMRPNSSVRMPLKAR